MRKLNIFNPEEKSTRRDFLKFSSILSLGYGISSYAATDFGKVRKSNYDYIIIGAGSSGCVIANKLTEDPLVKVLIVEAGGWDTKAAIHEADKWTSLTGTEVDWRYSTEEEPLLNNRRINWPRGKVVGGSSAINAMIYLKGHFSDFDNWSSLGNKGWSYKEVLPYFLQLENYSSKDLASYGTTGPLCISRKTCPEGPCTAFVEAAMELGYQGPNWDFNGLQQEDGAGLYPLTMKEGKRQSAATAFLTPILSRSNLSVVTSAQVTRLLFNKNRVVGVEYLHEGKLSQVEAGSEVIISAGTIETPKILMLSGIGPADYLRSLNLNVKSDLQGVGQNLQDHIAFPITYRSNLSNSTLPMPECAGLFVRTPIATNKSAADLQYMFYHSVGSKGTSSFIFLPIVTKPKSRGTITLHSADPFKAPVIKANYLQQQEDLKTLIEGFRLAKELASTKAFAKQRSDDGPKLNTEKEIIERIRSTASTMYHPVGTCKMGKDRMAVVNQDLLVHGVSGLRIADASIMPDIVNTNTNATCMMIGAVVADRIVNPKKY